MSQNITTTDAQPDTVAPVTDSASQVDTNHDVKSEATTPSIEMRDGKMFVDGTRVYTRDDTNKIAANAKREAEKTFLSDLNVDSIEAVKGVVQTLQETTPEAAGLDVQSLRSAVAKREATVEELTTQVQSLKTELLLKDHIGSLQNAMPGTWTAEQKDSVLTLMRAKDMLAIDGDTFAIRNGSDYLTRDGETPDYEAAVELVGKNMLGLPFGKRGVDVQYGETKASDNGNKVKPLDHAKLDSDAEYRKAYTSLRRYNPGLSRSSITHNMVMKQIDKTKGLK